MQRSLDDHRISEIKDAQYAAMRWDMIAARRFYQAFQHAEVAFDGMDTPCTGMKEKDEVAYLVGLISGTFAVLHDNKHAVRWGFLWTCCLGLPAPLNVWIMINGGMFHKHCKVVFGRPSLDRDRVM